MPGYVGNKEDYLRRLRRVEGQVRGLQRMIERDEYCIDVLTQVSAATKALQSVALGLLDEHLGHCVAEAIAEGTDRRAARPAEGARAGHQEAGVGDGACRGGRGPRRRCRRLRPPRHVR